MQQVFLCRPRCILRRHLDFDTNYNIIESIVLNDLTTNDVKIIADDRFDLPYIGNQLNCI